MEYLVDGGVKERRLGRTPDYILPQGDAAVRRWSVGYYPGVVDAYKYKASSYPRRSVHGEEQHHTRGETVAQNTADLKE